MKRWILPLFFLFAATPGPQVIDGSDRRLLSRGPGVVQTATEEDSDWPLWNAEVKNPELVTDFSTAGWPREYGRICVVFSSSPANEHRAIIDGRTASDDPRPYLAVVNDNRIRFGIQTVGSIAGGTVIAGKKHIACVDRTRGTTTLTLDGKLIGSAANLPAWDWHETVRLGSRYGGADPLGGEISKISWRRLRMTCDMRSSTCSDGRTITTQRATPVPCETFPGVWEIIPADRGCYSVRGLESWAQTTSYLSYGAELDRSPWGIQGAAEIMQLADGFRVCQTTSNVNSGIRQTHTIGLNETATLSVIARRNTASGLFLTPFSNGGSTITMSPAGWGTYSRTETRTAAATAFIYPRPGGVAHCVDLLAAWLTKSDTPGRPCWGGEAPVTCAVDRHTISTEGWPTESGEITITFTPGVSDSSRYILDTRTAADGTGYGINLYLTTNDVLVAGLCAGSCNNRNTAALPWSSGANTVRFKWSPTEAKVWANGVEVLNWEPTVTVESHRPDAHLGRHASAAINYLNGSISSLRVRSTP